MLLSRESERGTPAVAIAACLTLAYALVVRASLADADSIRSRYENMVVAAAAEISRRYAAPGELVETEACSCSYDVCGAEFPEMRCVANGHEGEEEDCGGRGVCGHTKMNLDLSSVRTPNDLLQRSLQLHEDVVRDICMTKGLEDVFKAVTNFTGDFIPWMYFASVQSGVIRTWPLMAGARDSSGHCLPYDPRVRPWYKVGTSEPKNVIIILQASDSMGYPLLFGTSYGSPSRWEVAKDAVTNLLGTLDSDNDNINVVVFNGGARPLLGGGVAKANDDNVRALLEALNGVALEPGVDTKVAMDMAFDLLESTDLKSCQNIIIHIGDGEDCTSHGKGNCSHVPVGTAGSRLPDGVQLNLAAVEARQRRIEETSSRAAIFTFTVEGGEDSLARQMACGNGGVWSMLNGRGEPLNKMGAYFQYLSYSMEPRDNAKPLVIISPLYTDAGGLGKMTTVVAPVFVAPKCADGSNSTEKLLLGMVGKDVPVQELRDQGLTEERVRVMINENLSKARACDDDYKYSVCKMQVLRASTSAQRFPAECPTRRWTPSGGETCHSFRGRHYLLIPQPQNFSQAQMQCGNLGGRLAELGPKHTEEEQHFLASLAPPDGAWLGLQPVENEWVWVGSMRKANSTHDKMWFVDPPKNTVCRAGFIDPRGILHNIGAKTCPVAMAAICEFNATFKGLPPTCQAEVQAVSPEELTQNTSRGCLEAGECTFGDSIDVDKGTFSKALCQGTEVAPGPPEPYSNLVCCEVEDLPDVCLQASNLQGNVTQSASSRGASLKIVALGAALAVMGALFIAITGVLATKKIQPGACSWMSFKSATRNGGGADDPDRSNATTLSLAVPDNQKGIDLQSFGALQRFLASQSSAVEAPLPGSIPSFLRAGQRAMGDEGSSGASRASRDDASPQPIELPSPRPSPRRSFPIDAITRVTTVENGTVASGAHGVVQEGVWIDDAGHAHKVAVKSARDLLGQNKLAVIKKEFEILAHVPPHPNIVWVVGARLDEEPIIVEEWLPGNLDHKIRKCSLTYEQILRISLGVAQGLDHLHQNQVVHYDIKPPNILLDDAGHAKLADFTCSRFKLASTISVSHVGTMGYMAPECLLEGMINLRVDAPDVCRARYSAQRIDIYSLGKVMLHCVTGSLDPEENNPRAEHLCADLWRVICMCICADPDGRPSCQQVVAKLEAMLEDPITGWDDWRLRKPKDELWSASNLDMDLNSQ